MVVRGIISILCKGYLFMVKISSFSTTGSCQNLQVVTGNKGVVYNLLQLFTSCYKFGYVDKL